MVRTGVAQRAERRQRGRDDRVHDRRQGRQRACCRRSPETRPYDDDGRPQAAHGETTCATVGNGKRVDTLLELAKASGRATGVVTTGRVTQAITAASYAHLCQRDGENAIAAQLVPGGPAPTRVSATAST